MRRKEAPFYNKRYLLNKNTNELHDLDFESTQCQIDEIKHNHIEMFDDEMKALIHQSIIYGNANGCYWCFQKHDSG